MTLFNITGDDTLTLFDRVFNDLSQDDVSAITFPNDLVKVKTGKNQNTIFAKDETGNNGTLVLRVMRGSSDDQFLQTRMTESEQDFASTILANGEFVKRLGDGQGNVIRDVYTLQGGMITKRVEAKENTSGDTGQAESVYTLTFALAKRSVQ
jgi:hypothetical protein